MKAPYHADRADTLAGVFFPDAPVPKRIGEYRVLRRVTAGEPFEVYVAKEEGALGFSREVTLRCVKRDEDPARATELAREARICTRLKHPSIEHVLGLVEERDRFVLVLEHAEGVTCETLLDILAARDEELPFAAAAYIAGTVATALAAAHAHQGDSGLKAPILHRAIGPAVVHVASDGTVKLGGFGLAKILDRTPDSAVGLTGGTRRLSPEQKKGAPATERSDVWSLGALCYTLFGGGSDAPLLETIAGRPPKLESGPGGVPLELAAAIDAALEEDPANRTITSAEIARWIARTTSLEDGHRALRALLATIPAEELGEPAGERGALRRVRAMERRASRGKLLRKSLTERVSESELEEVAPPEAPPPVLIPTGRTNTMVGVGPSSVRSLVAAPPVPEVAPPPVPVRIPTPPAAPPPVPARIPTPPVVAPPIAAPPLAAAPVAVPPIVVAPMPALARRVSSEAFAESLHDVTQELPRAPRRRRRLKIAIAAATIAALAIVALVVVLGKNPTTTAQAKPATPSSQKVASEPLSSATAPTAKTSAPVATAPATSNSLAPPKKKLPPEFGWLLVHSPPGKVMVAGRGRGAPNEVIAAPCGKVYVAVAKVDSKDKWIGWAAKGQPFTIPCDGTVGEVTLAPK
jgi:serine/threonine-protein kinase